MFQGLLKRVFKNKPKSKIKAFLKGKRKIRVSLKVKIYRTKRIS